MQDQQAYRSTGGPQDGNDEWNRLNAATRAVTNQMATATAVRVVAVHGRTVDVQPVVSQMDGAGNAVPHGTIHNVPVGRLQSGGVAIIIEPTIGDIGLAVFAHSDISTLKATGADSPPGSKRRFDWADAIYTASGLFGENVPTQYIRLGGGGIELTAPTVTTSASLTSGTGVTGTITTTDGKVVTFIGGIAVSIA